MITFASLWLLLSYGASGKFSLLFIGTFILDCCVFGIISGIKLPGND